jgi:pimeloyl-ACP methyl ester carboxylesterase
MGSLIALEAAARAPARCVGLALLGTVFPMRVAPALLEMARHDPDQTHRMINQWSFTLAHQAETDLCERNRQLLAAQPPASLPVDLGACDAYQGGLDAAREVRCPVLLLCAEQDKMTPLKALAPLEDALASAARVTRQVLPDSGHSMMSEAPEAVSAALLAFARQ